MRRASEVEAAVVVVRRASEVEAAVVVVRRASEVEAVAAAAAGAKVITEQQQRKANRAARVIPGGLSFRR